MISVDEARNQILSHIELLETVKVPLLESIGSALAENIVSDINIPPFNNSAMDGYAVIAADIKGASKESPATLKVIEDLAAGYVSKNRVTSGTAIRIMTGAPAPEGADAVVMVEETDSKNGQVNIYKEAAAGQNIRIAGEDIAENETVLPAGKTIRASDIGLLASLGKAEITVRRRPKVAIVSTGDELVNIDQPLAPGKIRNSNAYALASLVTEAGGEANIIGIAKDTVADVTSKINEGLKTADMVLTSGGVSVGDYDMVKDVLQEMGEMVFWKVAMKPAKPLAFGVIRGKPVFGLPGNPSSSMISFEQFVRCSIKKMAGHIHIMRPSITVIADSDIKKKPGRRYFMRVRLYKKGTNIFAGLSGAQGSGMIKTMTRAQGLLVVPEDASNVRAGTKLQAQLLYTDEIEIVNSDGDIDESLAGISKEGNIDCREALQLSESIDVDSKIIGKKANLKGVKIKNCMLGCFK